jgi:hypothetical protein
LADLSEVFSSANTVRAQLMAARLEQHGLHPTLVGENMAAVVGAGAFVVPCRILVPAREEGLARKTITELEAADASPPTEGGPTHCARCGSAWEPGFDACWNCGAFA